MGVTYQIRCAWCKLIHTSDFYDEIEESILLCRDRSPEWAKGTLATWTDPQIILQERIGTQEPEFHASYI